MLVVRLASQGHSLYCLLMSSNYRGPIITRAEAGSAGLVHYFTGKPCRQGHIAQRYVSSFGCVACSDISAGRWHAENRDKANAKSRRYNSVHPGKRAAAIKKWRDAHPEKVKEMSVRNRERHREEHRARARLAALQRQEKKAGRPRPAVCDICHTPEIPEDVKTRIVFDHCHQHGGFRGWICHRCNIALGHVDDSVERLEQLIAYLRGSTTSIVVVPRRGIEHRSAAYEAAALATELAGH